MEKAASKTTDILNLVNKTLELPTIPEVLTKLNGVISDPESSADDVAKVISVDPAVSTNILRIVNSAYYGLQVRVSSVSLAISVMGFTMTRKIALKAAVFSVFGKQSKFKVENFDPVGFWCHSIFTGVAARSLGQKSPVFESTHSEDLYVCGLLHDIGKIIMLEKAGKEYTEVLAEAAATSRPEAELEKQAFGFTHADVGSVLAIKWFLPEDLTVAIRYHHAPDQDPYHRSLSSLIHLADHLAWSAGNPSTKGTTSPQFQHDVYDQVGLAPELVEELLPDIREDFAATELPS
ncbi:MAG: HDOD domain-containing protein [Planctomycetota bacterium]|jgi:HD-like signal output (HDOD) protein